jgi:transcriptional regulator with XRE-family HTH domain
MNRLSAANPAPSPLAIHRFSAGLTQAELGARAGRTRATVANLEAGRNKPRRLTAESLAAVLGVEPSDLFPNDDGPAANRAIGKVRDDGAHGPS